MDAFTKNALKFKFGIDKCANLMYNNINHGVCRQNMLSKVNSIRL